MKNFLTALRQRTINVFFDFSWSLADHFSQFHALSYNQASDAVALPKISKRLEIGGNGGQSWWERMGSLTKFQTTSENFDHDSNRVFIYIWHYNERDRLEWKFPYTRTKFQCFIVTTDLPYCSKNLSTKVCMIPGSWYLKSDQEYLFSCKIKRLPCVCVHL